MHLLEGLFLICRLLPVAFDANGLHRSDRMVAAIHIQGEQASGKGFYQSRQTTRMLYHGNFTALTICSAKP
eukprot:1880095-Pleurochrysis_carterae.AAC.1